MAVPFIMPADAIRAAIYPQERKIAVAKQTGEANRKREAQKNAERNAYRLQNGWLDVNRVMMSDEDVDRAMQQNTAQLSTPRFQTTDERRASQRQFAKMQADKNNEEAKKAVATMLSLTLPSTYVNTGSSYLDTMMDLAIPFGLGQASKGFNLALKTSPSIGRAVVSGGKAVVSPRAVTNFALQATPFVAAAADNENSGGSFITEYPGVAALAGYTSLAALRSGYRKWFKEPPGRPVLKEPDLDPNKFKTKRAYQKEYDKQMAINQKQFEEATAKFEDRKDVQANARRREFIVPKTGWGKVNRFVVWPSLIGLAGSNIYLANKSKQSTSNKTEDDAKTDTLEIVPEFYNQIPSNSTDTTSTDTYTIY